MTSQRYIMQQVPDYSPIEPYHRYRASSKALENFAEQSRFCYRVAHQYVSGSPGTPPDIRETQEPSSPTLGQQEHMFTHTYQTLLEQSFVMEWLLFETFLRNTLFALLATYPKKLIEQSPDYHLTYSEVFQASGAF